MDDGYITVNPAITAHKFNVVIMRQGRGEEYEVFRISDPLPKKAADELAKSWAAACRLEIRQ